MVYQFDYEIPQPKPVGAGTPVEGPPDPAPRWHPEEAGAVIARMMRKMYEMERLLAPARLVPFDELPDEYRQRLNAYAQAAYVASGVMPAGTEIAVLRAELAGREAA